MYKKICCGFYFANLFRQLGTGLSSGPRAGEMKTSAKVWIKMRPKAVVQIKPDVTVI